MITLTAQVPDNFARKIAIHGTIAPRFRARLSSGPYWIRSVKVNSGMNSPA